MGHQIVAGDAHEEDDQNRGEDPFFAAHERDGGHARGAGGHMPRGEGAAVLGGRADGNPPLLILRDHLKGAQAAYAVLEDDVGDQSPAADRAEDAHAEVPFVGHEHEDQRQQEEHDALFTEEGDHAHQRRQHGPGLVAEHVQDIQEEMVVAGKEAVQPRGRCRSSHEDPSFCNLLLPIYTRLLQNASPFRLRIPTDRDTL